MGPGGHRNEKCMKSGVVKRERNLDPFVTVYPPLKQDRRFLQKAMEVQWICLLLLGYQYGGTMGASFKGKGDGKALSPKECEELKEKIKHANPDGRLQWQPKCEGYPKREIQISLGLLPDRQRKLLSSPPPNRIIPKRPGESQSAPFDVELPESYDARTVWSKKCPSFDYIYQQDSCGNCYAVSAMGMINDRVCMYSEEEWGKNQTIYSVTHMTSCVQKGCNGGSPGGALDYWRNNGYLTGGNPASGQPAGCQPMPDKLNDLIGLACNDTCVDGTNVSEAVRSFGSDRYIIKLNEEDIMREIFLFGPVIATFSVYDDLAYRYDKGIYKQVSKEYIGPHAVKIYGWGEEKGVRFWRASNSWGSWWGDKGFFKIQRGTNECGLEDDIYAAIPAEGLAIE